MSILNKKDRKNIFLKLVIDKEIELENLTKKSSKFVKSIIDIENGLYWFEIAEKYLKIINDKEV